MKNNDEDYSSYTTLRIIRNSSIKNNLNFEINFV